jgi:hypothetical protein
MEGHDGIEKKSNQYKSPKERRRFNIDYHEYRSQKDDASKGDIKAVFLDWENPYDKEDNRDR